MLTRIRLLGQAFRIGWHVYRSARELYAQGHKLVMVRTIVVPADFGDEESGVLKWDDEDQPPQQPPEE